ncbi:hypothetical protein [Angustibacter sp. Root456]|nr:hypothetical protein [Angustibacter sp. Root456]
MADEVGDAAYTLGVLATPVGAVPVGYPPLVVDVAVACGKLPDHPLRTA